MFFLLEALPQPAPSTDWFLESIRIGAPILSALVLAFWISRSNEKYKIALTTQIEKFKNDLTNQTEKYKNELAKEIHRFQTLHVKQISILDELIIPITKIQQQLDAALNLADDSDGFYHDEERQMADLMSESQQIRPQLEDLRVRFELSRMYLNSETCQHIQNLINSFQEALSLFTLHVDEDTDGNWVPALTPGGLKDAQNLLKSVIPSIRNRFEGVVKSMLG